MPMPYVTGIGAAASGIGAITPGLPTPLYDSDVLLMFLENQDAAAPPAVAGWADVMTAQFVSTGTVTRLSCRWARAVAGMSAPTVPDAGDHLIGRILGIRGAALQGNPWSVTSSGTDTVANTAVSIPGATTNARDCLVVAAFSTGTDTATAQTSAFTNASLANVSLQMANWTTSGGGGGFAVCTGELPEPGAYSATTATLVTANPKALMSIAIRGAQMLAVPVPTISQHVAG